MAARDPALPFDRDDEGEAETLLIRDIHRREGRLLIAFHVVQPETCLLCPRRCRDLATFCGLAPKHRVCAQQSQLIVLGRGEHCLGHGTQQSLLRRKGSLQRGLRREPGRVLEDTREVLSELGRRHLIDLPEGLRTGRRVGFRHSCSPASFVELHRFSEY